MNPQTRVKALNEIAMEARKNTRLPLITFLMDSCVENGGNGEIVLWLWCNEELGP